VLDEPTNDLDLETLDLLQEVIADYDGTVLIVSHDRDFLDRTVTVTLGLDGSGTVDIVAGGYEDWEAKRKKPSVSAKTKSALPPSTGSGAGGAGGGPVVDSPNLRRAPASGSARVKLSYKDQRDYDLLPARIEELEAEISKGEHTLADPGPLQPQPGRVRPHDRAARHAPCREGRGRGAVAGARGVRRGVRSVLLPFRHAELVSAPIVQRSRSSPARDRPRRPDLRELAARSAFSIDFARADGWVLKRVQDDEWHGPGARSQVDTCYACDTVQTTKSLPRKCHLDGRRRHLVHAASSDPVEIGDPVERQLEHQLAAARRPVERLLGDGNRFARADHAPEDIFEPLPAAAIAPSNRCRAAS
jgi:hypothetical protein